MKEPAVALTDYFIAAEAALFAWSIAQSPDISSTARTPFIWFFLATAVAAGAGGTVHGFFAAGTLGSVVLWRLTLLALGVVALMTWTIAARLILSGGSARFVEVAAAVVAAGYAIVILFVDDRFGVAIAHYLPPSLFLLVAFAWAASHRHDGRLWTLTGAAGMVLTFAAAFVQQRGIAVHPAYFNHNATYHAIQAVGLLMIFLGARGVG
jgi:hypothetical protein